MLTSTAPTDAAPLNEGNLTKAELATMHAACRGLMAQGGDSGELAGQILRISAELQALTDKADAFLKRTCNAHNACRP